MHTRCHSVGYFGGMFTLLTLQSYIAKTELWMITIKLWMITIKLWIISIKLWTISIKLN